ncbi:MAG TPA: hypothetical protein VMZ06_14230 [Candidatus Bathyarchaeia archaeon]|nr:hypothetical protein [Candidatus Bathyarchaeia archaeon]
MYRLLLVALSVLVAGFTNEASSQSLSYTELLAKIQSGIRAPGLSYRIKSEVYQSKSDSVKSWDPGLLSRFDCISDGTHLRIEEQGIPSDFGKSPKFKTENVSVFDGEVYKSLHSIDSRPRQGMIAEVKQMPDASLGGLIVGGDILSREELIDKNILFDSAKNLYRVATVPEYGGQVVFWSDPARNFEIVKVEFLVNGKLKNFDEIVSEQIGGIWVPKDVKHYDMVGENPVLTKETKMVSFDPNPEITPSTFELDFPDGVKVMDHRNKDDVARSLEEAMQKRMDNLNRKMLSDLPLQATSNQNVERTPVRKTKSMSLARSTELSARNSGFLIYLLPAIVILVLVVGGVVWMRRRKA